MSDGSSNVSILGVSVLGTMVILTFSLARPKALLPLLITTCYIPLGQEVVVAGLNLQFFRLLLLAAWCRVWTRQEHLELRLTRMDFLFMWWVAATVVGGTLAELTVARFVSRAGVAFNAVGTYFLVRCWVRNFDEVKAIVRALALLIVPLAASMMVEKFTSRNIFSVFGGVPELTIVREGRLRCQGAFRHPILAGTYGATLFPLFMALALSEIRDRSRCLLGAGAAVFVTYAAASSGPFLVLLCSLGGWAMWPMRQSMRVARRGAVLLLIVLALAMNAPVYYIIARLSEVFGGTGWYRSYIIDQAIAHFDEWWLVGSTYTAHWAPAGETVPADPNNMDIINHYVAEALGGGLIKLGLFIALIVTAFKIAGRWANASGESLDRSSRIFSWGLGVGLMGHCVSFFSVAYFDQIVVMWYWLLAVFSTLSRQTLQLPSEYPAAAVGESGLSSVPQVEL